MECNKEEAIRAKEIAEKKMQNGDFIGAQKIALKAQRLYPNIDNISQLLTVCDVHCSAEKKLNGSEMDWYGILQIERLSDEAVIRKQYRKLALSLHPDKNRFAGAEAAFKLICEANRVLTDTTKRQVYDMKCRSFKGPTAQKPATMNVFPKARTHYANTNLQKPQESTFWTCCHSCGIRFQYYRVFLNKVLRCQSCQNNFIANDMGVQSMPSAASWSQFINQKGFPNHGPPKVAPKSSDRKPAGTKAEPTSKAGKTGHFSGNSQPHASNAGNGAEIGGSSKTQEKSNGHVKVGSGNDGAAMPKPKPDRKNHKESTASKTATRKRQRKPVEAKQKESSAFEENLSEKKIKRGEYQGKGEEGHVLKKGDTKSDKNDGKPRVDYECKQGTDDTPKSEILEYPNPDFSDFDKDKAEDVFDVNQLWALFDPLDGMPRFYALVKKVFLPGFKLQITWLEASFNEEREQKWSEVGLPVGCGKFEFGSTQRCVDRLMFSHQMECIRDSRKGTYLIYPKKGETWALFKDWDMKWCLEPEKHKPPYQFELVEVVSDFMEHVGIGVAYLGKVNGFVSIFQQADHDGVRAFCVPPCELYRFSHRVPSFRMTGSEGKGVPAGSFELDPFCLPTDLLNLGNNHSDLKREKQKLDAETIDPCSKSPKNKVSLMKDLEKKISAPKKNENGHESLIIVLGLSARGSSKIFKNREETNVVDARQFTKKNATKNESRGNNLSQREVSAQNGANEKIKTPKKQQKKELAADALKPRRSPRDLSRRTNQAS